MFLSFIFGQDVVMEGQVNNNYTLKEAEVQLYVYSLIRSITFSLLSILLLGLSLLYYLDQFDPRVL